MRDFVYLADVPSDPILARYCSTYVLSQGNTCAVNKLAQVLNSKRQDHHRRQKNELLQKHLNILIPVCGKRLFKARAVIEPSFNRLKEKSTKQV